MKLTQFYSTAPVCTPSRASLMTGRLSLRNGIYTAKDWPADNGYRVFMPISTGGLPETEITLPQRLREEGYNTYMVGKWHLGHVESLPTARGFSDYYGIPFSHQEGCPYCSSCLPSKFAEPCQGWQNIFPPVPLVENTTIIEQPVNMDTLTDRYTQKAVDFLESDHTSPFFLFVAHHEAHVPVFSASRGLGKSRRGRFGDALEMLDESVGKILDAIRGNSKISNNTYVFFTSDNGAWLKQEQYGGNNGALRGGKGETWEGGVRVPAIVWGPDVASSSVSMSVTTMADIFPTFLELAQVSLPDRYYDGASFVDLLGGVEREVENPVFLYRDQRLHAVRLGPYKAHFWTRSGFGSDPPAWQEPPLLFNLEIDPSEVYPLDVTLPEYALILTDILEVVAQHNATLPNPLPEPQMDGIGPVGLCCDRELDCYCSQHGEEKTGRQLNWIGM
eukprot:TRINITY_DN3373_c0_g1_i1.p1 TRINITY_DN3373_c0_g1~~TRINITY_DN3373_c0_g1_i1.p1  ORF type:complete len:499 (+),score=104.66 TRINITY_DN3373_c0_g1_i1:161-1498(+)